ncbi:MAG: S8 family peptidase, partial [Terriglobales bacterium]
DKSQITYGRKDRPLSAPAFSAAWGRVLAMTLLALSAIPSFAGSNPTPRNGTPKFASDLQQRVEANGMVTIIVQHRQMPSTAHLRSMQGRGAAIKSQFHSIRAVTMRVPASMLAELAADPNVTYITPDRTQKMAANPVTEEYATAVEADVAASQYAFNGTGVGVAVIDSGIAAHPDLNNANGVSRVVYNQSFVAGDSTTSDEFGHGTHVSGLIGGSGASSGTANGYAATYAGVAPNVNFINLRVLDENGSGTDSGVIAAIEEAITLQSTYNIRVINMSLGRPVFESYALDPVDQAVEAAWKAGIVVVAAAGNNGRYLPTDGFGTIVVPGNDPSVITVGATMTELTPTRADDQIASYSSKGPTTLDHTCKPDLTAPGNRQVSLRVSGSTLDTTYPQYEVAPTSGSAMYYELSGTSMATPIVTGAVALMLQQTPSLTPDQVKARLMKTAWKGVGQYTYSHDSLGNLYNNEYDLFTYGAGYLNIDAALGSTDVATGSALSPTAVFNANGSVTITNTTPDSNFAGSSVVWGATSVVWGDSVVWGANTISASSVVWGATSVVWGATSVTGDSVVWGATTNVATATSALSDGDPGDN